MHNDSISVTNKIITYNNLLEIFDSMQNKLVHYKKIYESEERENSALSYSYQKWTFKDNGSKLKITVLFKDNSQIDFDDYNNFVSIFNNRLEDIKGLFVYFSLLYGMSSENGMNDFYSQHINMTIYEDKMSFDISLNSNDNKIEDIYELIKNIINNAPPKYDDVIKKKGLITNIVGLAIGFIPALIISIILIFVPELREVYTKGIVVFPILTTVLAFIIGTVIGYNLLDKYYKNIVPDKKYVGYNSQTYQSIYKDDIDSFVGTSEILIGKNIHNLENREEIKRYKDKYKKWLPYELAIVLVFSIFVLFLG